MSPFNRLSVIHDYGTEGDYETAAKNRKRQYDVPDVDEKSVQVRLKAEMYARRAAAELAADIDVISRAALTPRDAA